MLYQITAIADCAVVVCNYLKFNNFWARWWQPTSKNMDRKTWGAGGEIQTLNKIYSQGIHKGGLGRSLIHVQWRSNRMSYKVFPTFYHGKRGVINADNVHKCPLLLLHIFLFSKCPPFRLGWRARSREGHVGLQWGLQFKSDPSLIIVLPASQDEYILQTKLKLHKIWQSFCMYSPPGPAPAKTTQSEAFTFQLNLFFLSKKWISLQQSSV